MRDIIYALRLHTSEKKSARYTKTNCSQDVFLYLHALLLIQCKLLSGTVSIHRFRHVETIHSAVLLVSCDALIFDGATKRSTSQALLCWCRFYIIWIILWTRFEILECIRSFGSLWLVHWSIHGSSVPVQSEWCLCFINAASGNVDTVYFTFYCENLYNFNNPQKIYAIIFSSPFFALSFFPISVIRIFCKKKIFFSLLDLLNPCLNAHSTRSWTFYTLDLLRLDFFSRCFALQKPAEVLYFLLRLYGTISFSHILCALAENQKDSDNNKINRRKQLIFIGIS